MDKKKRKRAPITAKEFLESLQFAPEVEERARQERAQRKRRSEMMKLQEQSLCLELKEAGVMQTDGTPLKSVWDFFDAISKQGAKQAVPKLTGKGVEVLCHHAANASYFPMVREAIIRALTGRYGLPAYDLVASELVRLADPLEFQADCDSAAKMQTAAGVYEDPEDTKRYSRAHVEAYRFALVNFLGEVLTKDLLDRTVILLDTKGLDPGDRLSLAKSIRHRMKLWRMNDHPAMEKVQGIIDS